MVASHQELVVRPRTTIHPRGHAGQPDQPVTRPPFTVAQVRGYSCIHCIRRRISGNLISGMQLAGILVKWLRLRGLSG